MGTDPLMPQTSAGGLPPFDKVNLTIFCTTLVGARPPLFAGAEDFDDLQVQALVSGSQGLGGAAPCFQVGGGAGSQTAQQLSSGSGMRQTNSSECSVRQLKLLCVTESPVVVPTLFELGHSNGGGRQKSASRQEPLALGWKVVGGRNLPAAPLARQTLHHTHQPADFVKGVVKRQ